MGSILLIEDDRNVHGLIEKLFPKEEIKVFKTYPPGKEENIENPEGAGMKNTPVPALKEAVREYLRGEIERQHNSNIRGSVIGEVEKTLIGIVLEEEKGNQVRAARRLGINRNTLRKKIRELNIVTRVISR